MQFVCCLGRMDDSEQRDGQCENILLTIIRPKILGPSACALQFVLLNYRERLARLRDNFSVRVD